MSEASLEQGFNEKELADIMQEIESLEKELDQEKQAPPVASSDTGPAISTTPDLKLVDAAEQEISKLDSPQVVEAENEILEVAGDASESNSSLKSQTLNTGGHFVLASSVQSDFKLDFMLKGKKVSIIVENENLLKINLDSGASVSLPLT